jgi:microcystin degradation protein MlrC
MSVARPGLAVPSIFSATARPPLAGIIAQARQMEARYPGWLDISVMAGFSYADAHNTGFSVIAVADDATVAAAAANEVSALIATRKEALYRPEHVHSVDEAVALALAPPAARPIVLLEHADRTNDSTYLLSALVDAGAQGVAVPMLWDSAAAEAAHAAGQGARLDLEIGGWSSPAAGPRRAYACEVLRSGPVRYAMSGPMLTGMEVDLGMTALVRIGGITVSLVSAFAFAVDEDAFTVFGQQVRDFSTIVLRSKTHFRAVYEPLAERIIIVDTPDHGPADLTRLPYTRLDRTRTYPFAAQ